MQTKRDLYVGVAIVLYTKRDTKSVSVIHSYTGHHVFAASNQTEMEGWIKAINDVTKDDKLRQKNALSKSKLSATAVTGEPTTDKVVDHSLQGQTNPSELMGKLQCNVLNLIYSLSY